MRSFLLFLLTFHSAIFTPVLAILGGEAASKGQFPYIVDIKASYSREKNLCGGFLISPDTVLTAARCVWDIEPYLLHARVGSLSSSSGGRIIPVQSVIAHPGYDSISSLNDIAILRLAEPATGIPHAPLVLDDGKPEEATWVTLAGWGGTGTWMFSQLLRFVKTVVVPLDICAYYYADVIAPQHICTYVQSKGSTARDAGGPVIGDDHGGVVGIITSGSDYDSDPEAGLPEFHTRISSFGDWILAHEPSVNVSRSRE